MVPYSAISRRNCLRASGIALGLPLLESLPGTAEKPAPSQRPLCVFMEKSFGVVPDAWFPAQPGDLHDMQLPPCLQALDPFRDSSSLFGGLSMLGMKGDNHYAMEYFLSAAISDADPSRNLCNSISIDQVIAQHVAQDLRYPCIPLGCVKKTYGTRSGSLSKDASGTPIPAEIDPVRLFEMCFGETGNPEILRQQFQRKKSFIDKVSADIQRLKQQLSQVDQRKVDEYIQSVRQIEAQLQRDILWADKPKPEAPFAKPVYGKRPTEDPLGHMRLIFDLIIAAYQSNSACVFTYHLPFIDKVSLYSENGLHTLAHAQGKDQQQRDAHIAMIRDMVSCVAEFAKKLHNIQLSDGSSLYEQSFILLGGGNEDAGLHRQRNLPILIMGNAQKRFHHGSYRVYPEEQTPLGNLHRSILHGFDIPCKRFGDSNGIFNEWIRGA